MPSLASVPPDPDPVLELAATALHSLPPEYPVAFLGDDWLLVRDVHEALSTGVMDGLAVLDCLHFQHGGSLVRPDLLVEVGRVLNAEAAS